jgi:UDP-N-acetylglucosamine:LPS N-acetylglucosamine transferase
MGPTYVIREIAGKKVALFGIITHHVPEWVSQRTIKHMRFQDAYETAKKTVDILKRLEKPDVIICTGVLAMIPLCLICKLFGKKLIFIESFAKVTSPTRSGKLLYRFADQFYVQWPQMLEVHPNAIYVGGIY